MTEHTAGPWEWEFDVELGCNNVFAAGESEHIVCVVDDCGWRIRNGADDAEYLDFMDADARLIAAAPDLLAACEALLESNLQLQRAVHGGLRNGPAEDMAVAAVAKARGEVTP